MSSSRRTFLKTSAILAAGLPGAVAQAQRLRPRQRGESETVDALHLVGAADIPAMLAGAVEAAKKAGATYADARCQLGTRESWGWNEPEVHPPLLYMTSTVGVRALYQGYWGYATLTRGDFDGDAVAKLGTDAAMQARAGANGGTRKVELAPAPVVNGSWTTPVEIDPFTVSWAEKCDFGNSIFSFIPGQPFNGGTMGVRLEFGKRTNYFASSEGSQYVQTLIRTRFNTIVAAGPDWRTKHFGVRQPEGVTSSAAAGWEYVVKSRIYDQMRQLIQQAHDASRGMPVDVGRYDMVFDGAALAKIAGAQLGDATEADRVMGYLGPYDGSSYINDPLAMLGTLQVGSPLLNVTTNRSMPGGLATVKWDDEGVTPDDITLVKDGILTDLQTTRESASWFAPYYSKVGQPVRSHGCATLLSPGNLPQLGPSNLVIAPAKTDTSFEALCSGIKKGLAVIAGTTRADQQRLNAESYGDVVYEIRNGKIGAPVDGATILTRAPQLWKGLTGLGGAQTVTSIGVETRREGMDWEPNFTVRSPAAAFKQVPVTNNPVRV